MHPRKDPGCLGTLSLNSFPPPPFQFDVWVSNRKRLLVVWALQVLRSWEDESRCRCWNLNASRIPGTLQASLMCRSRGALWSLFARRVRAVGCAPRRLEIRGVTERGEGSNAGDRPLSSGGSRREPTRALAVAEACPNLSFPVLILKVDLVAPREDCRERECVERACAGQDQCE